MTWLEHVRQKNFAPYTNGSDKSAKSHESDQKNFAPYKSGSAKSDKSQDEASSVTFGTASPEGLQVFAEVREAIIVAYQRFSLDYDLPDGTYTPEDMQRARLRVTPGPVLRYRLRWPGGSPQPLAAQEPRARRTRDARFPTIRREATFSAKKGDPSRTQITDGSCPTCGRDDFSEITPGGKLVCMNCLRGNAGA
jgi:hypothetical protein